MYTAKDKKDGQVYELPGSDSPQNWQEPFLCRANGLREIRERARVRRGGRGEGGKGGVHVRAALPADLAHQVDNSSGPSCL